MKSINTIHIKHLLFTVLLAFACSVFLLWFKSNAAIAVTDWSQWKNENLVSFTGDFQLQNKSHEDDKPGKNNACPHQLAGSLCQTHHTKRKYSRRNATS